MKQNKKPFNYVSVTFWFAFATMIVTLGLWFVPNVESGNFKTRKINIISEVVDDSVIHEVASKLNKEWLDGYFDDLFVSPTTDLPTNNSQNIAKSHSERFDVMDSIKSIATQPSEAEIENLEYAYQGDQMQDDSLFQRVDESSSDSIVVDKVVPIDAANDKKIPIIEQYSEEKFQNFLGQLKSGGVVRIAIAGDSFIEGDIFAQDVREKLQVKYGGQGVGFVPITSQVAGFRRSVEHKFNGWTDVNVVNNRGNFHLSGYLYYPQEMAWVAYKGTNYRRNLNQFDEAKLLFINTKATKIEAVINDTIRRSFAPTSSDQLQAIEVKEKMSSIRFNFSNVDGFTAYGALLDGKGGVSVDNYSIRSYSGVGLAKMTEAIAQQADKIFPYDLIILQYGLNAVSEDVTNYNHYAKKMVGVIEHLKQIMPNTAILLMGVSDRQSRGNGKTMAEIVALENTQRAVAKLCNVPFWSTLYAMQNEGGMGVFVKKGWAAKDYTHLSPKGGKVVAEMFVEALEGDDGF